MAMVGVRELRQNLSVYLRRVARGEALTVTDHGRPVALLAPMPSDDDVLADLVVAGRVTAASGRLDDLPPPPTLPSGERSLSDVLQEMRDEDDR